MMPEQYRTGRAYFMDFEFSVTRDTFIPRPETELLVEKVTETIRDTANVRSWRILDIGTGSGNIAISLTKYVENCTIIGLDISEDALRLARINAEACGVGNRVSFVRSDLTQGLSSGPIFDIIVSNPPYIALYDVAGLPDEVKYEPFSALYGGVDGLDYVRRIARNAKLLLKEGGYLFMEIGYDQSINVRRIFGEEGYRDVELFKDYASIDRIVRGTNG
ncbi:MAG: peptide chain release factor N(5)-glutamine methyltransferase [Candidatus Omnitrophica bacterium]|nr:peptide chain release factor N(5)-glutamine methyltransferase [Candidatus Omnitrophota bacterium]